MTAIYGSSHRWTNADGTLVWYYFRAGEVKAQPMPLQEQLIKKLSRIYEPDALIHQTFRGKDIAFKTNNAGEPVLLFIGRKNEDGDITGERFVRTLIRKVDGTLLKDHWERKGKAS